MARAVTGHPYGDGMRYDEALGAFVELAASRHNAIHSDEAAEIITTRRLRAAQERGLVTRLYPRVWALTHLGTPPGQELRAAVTSSRGAAATSTSAAWLHGWLPKPTTSPVVWVPSDRNVRPARFQILRWKHIDPVKDITEVDHICTLSRAATLCTLGPHVDARTLERCLDAFLRTDSMRWLEETMERLGQRVPSGVSHLREVLDDPRRVNGVTDSWFERAVADLVALPWLPPIKLQHEVVTDSVRYRLDIACPALKLGVEAHSRTFHWGAGKEDADNVRDLALSAAGWQLLYVTWSQIGRPDTFVSQFAAAARARAELFGVDIPAA